MSKLPALTLVCQWVGRRHSSGHRRHRYHSRYSQYGRHRPLRFNRSQKATVAAARYKGPVYIRFTREKTPVMTTEETPFEIGQGGNFREGNDVTIIGCGPLVYEALKAAEELAKEGIEADVINNHTIKPMDKETILKSVKKPAVS